MPPGFGGMPPVEGINRHLIGSEYFCLSSRFVFAAGTPAFTQVSDILVTPQDGDFWCDQITCVSWEEDPAGNPDRDTQHFLASMVTIRDNRTGESLIHNPPVAGQAIQFPADSVPINLFRKLPQSGTENGIDYDGSTPAPSGFRATGTLIQPYCFTRQGGISVSITTLFAVPALISFDVTLAFSGWKEYANASR